MKSQKVEINNLILKVKRIIKKIQNGSGTLGNNIKWNFTKFVIDQKGQVVSREGVPKSSHKLGPQIEKLFETPF